MKNGAESPRLWKLRAAFREWPGAQPVSLLNRQHSKTTGSLYPSQRSQGAHSGNGVQDLDARVMVAVERRHCARTPSRDRVCRVGKPYPEVG